MHSYHIKMISKGRDVSSLFPDVVKNVVCKNLEVKKLVYMYLMHYAELEPELALLSINTFQKALSDQNPLIRASALRVMSSIRVLDIFPHLLFPLPPFFSSCPLFISSFPSIFSTPKEI